MVETTVEELIVEFCEETFMSARDKKAGRHGRC